jgi:hypothetical protein
VATIRACVFCGAALAKSDRTKEHVLPMWLLRMTGDPNRQFQLGSNLVTGDAWLRAASSITFPACGPCNQNYGKGLEVQAHKIVRAIQDGKSISISNAYRLLDWLDKVRIGLWLGILMLQREGDIRPRFSIDTRRGCKDRVAIVAVDQTDKTLRLNFGGTDNNLFRLTQCALYLRINNIRILSFSADYLLTRETGLPHGENQYLVERRPGVIGSNVVPGTYNLSQDWDLFTQIGGTVLAQPIIDARLLDPKWALNLYANSRVIGHTKNLFRASGVENFLRIVPLQLITNAIGTFAYHPNKRERLKLVASSQNDDTAFMRLLYMLMLDRVLRTFPKEIKLADGRLVMWLPGSLMAFVCIYQLRERLRALGIRISDTDDLIEEIQRISRILEEQHASAGGTFIQDHPLIG